MNAHFYLTKGANTVGPCTLDDLRNYLAYGSVSGNDLVKRTGESGWMPLRQLAELSSGDGGPGVVDVVATRRRTARYREYARVPNEHRAGWILSQLFWGMFFPPLLWRGAIAIYQGKIFTHAKDENGYLLTWSRRAEVVVSVLLIANSLAWWWGGMWLCDHGTPVARELLSLTQTGIADLQDWLSQP